MGISDTPSAPETALATSEPPLHVNGMEDGQERKPIAPRTRVAEFSKQVPADIVERRWRRKSDLATLDGLAREHARLIARIHGNAIPLQKAEVLSRAYSRQRDIVSELERRRLLEAIRAALVAGGHLSDDQLGVALEALELDTGEGGR